MAFAVYCHQQRGILSPTTLKQNFFTQTKPFEDKELFIKNRELYRRIMMNSNVYFKKIDSTTDTKTIQAISKQLLDTLIEKENLTLKKKVPPLLSPGIVWGR